MTTPPWAPHHVGGAADHQPTAPTPPPMGGQTSPMPLPPPPQGPPPLLPLPPQRPPRGTGPRTWAIVLAFVAVIVVAVGATAAITAAIFKPTEPQPNSSTAIPTARKFSAEEQSAAKRSVCEAYDLGVRGSTGQGGVVTNGQLNVPVVLRTLNAIVVVQQRVSPATPPDVAKIADRYITTQSDLTTAALGGEPVDKLVELTKTGNTAIDAFSDICGLPR